MTRGGHLQRGAGAVQLDAVVGGVEGEALTRGDAGDIRDVADDVGRFGQHGLHFRRYQPVISRPEARDGKPAGHSAISGRRPWPWTSTIAKYGQSWS